MSRSTRTGAEFFVEALETYGVEYLFGNPGTTELPVVQSLSDSTIEYVLALHEDIAVGMASGYARTRRFHSHTDSSINPLGVVNLHVAPGLAHGIGNLIGADFAGSPILVTAGNHSTDFRHEEPILSGELVEMVDQYTKWSDEVLDVDALPTMLRRAVRVALTPPTGPVFLGLPLDVMLDETEAPVERLGRIPNAGRGDPTAIKSAANMLIDADEPVLVVGDEVSRAGPDAIDSAVAFAEASGARVHSEVLSAEVSFPQDHPQWASRMPGRQALMSQIYDADTLVFVGISTNTTSIKHDGRLVPTEANTIHIGPDTWELGKNEHSDISIIGDPGHVLAEITDQISTQIDEAELAARLDRMENKLTEIFGDDDSTPGSDPDDPRASKDELGQALAAAAADAYFVNEGITSSGGLYRNMTFAPGQMIGNKSGGLGYGLPAAVGAALAEGQHENGRDVISFIGDGSYLYYPHSLYSAVRSDVDLTVVVADNRNYRILKNNTIRVLGGEEDDHEFVGMDFEPPVDIPMNANSHGATTKLVDDGTVTGIQKAIETAREDSTPSVLDVLIHD